MDLRPMIEVTYPFTKIVEAFQFQERGRHFGKICIEC
jgi:NADPH:quinone reductase-like Zn-dependent oxidoreductase